MKTVLKQVLIVLGIILGILLIAAVGVYIYYRTHFAAPSVTIGAAEDLPWSGIRWWTGTTSPRTENIPAL